MLIKTINELRVYLPNHTMNDLETMQGFFENSEQDFLRDRLGAPLLAALQSHYDALPTDQLVPGIGQWSDENPRTPWHQLLQHAQRCVVYNAFERSADLYAVSVNNSGINIVSADSYDAASKDAMKAYKDRLWKETRMAVDRMLVFLEELAQTYLPSSETEALTDPVVGDTSPTPTDAHQIVELWHSSRYFYLAGGLLINTATRMHDFIDIEEIRERFIQMLPDMRFIQRNYLRTELGAALFDRLLDAYLGKHGQLTDEEMEIVLKLQELLALYTQQRSRVFKFDTAERKRIEEECIGLKRELLAYVAEWRTTHNDDGTLKPITPETQTEAQAGQCGDCCGVNGDRSLHDGHPYWGDKGSVFVMPGII